MSFSCTNNSVDVHAAELVEYFLADPDTRVIGLYAEDIRNGRAFFDVLRAASGKKPIVVLVGGQMSQGKEAAISHTGSLVSNIGIWRGLGRQSGAVIVDTLDQFLDVLLAFQTLTPRKTVTHDCVLSASLGIASAARAYS